MGGMSKLTQTYPADLMYTNGYWLWDSFRTKKLDACAYGNKQIINVIL